MAAAADASAYSLAKGTKAIGSNEEPIAFFCGASGMTRNVMT
jgi:hypothetical protein